MTQLVKTLFTLVAEIMVMRIQSRGTAWILKYGLTKARVPSSKSEFY